MNEELRLEAGINELPFVANQILEFSANLNVIAFHGDLGAGKTTLIKNICNLLHVEDEVSSPTFSLVNEYRTASNELVYHFDFYRIEDEFEALDMGCEDYFYGSAVCLIEWPEKVENLLPKELVEVEIAILEDKRTFYLKKMKNV